MVDKTVFVTRKYFFDKAESESSPYSHDVTVRKKLRDMSMKLTGFA